MGYVAAKARYGMGAYRRGMGRCGRGMGDCTNVVNSVGTDSVTGEACVIGTPTTVNVPLPTSGQSLTQWLNANSTTVGIGAAAFLALMLFGRAGR